MDMYTESKIVQFLWDGHQRRAYDIWRLLCCYVRRYKINLYCLLMMMMRHTLMVVTVLYCGCGIAWCHPRLDRHTIEREYGIGSVSIVNQHTINNHNLFIYTFFFFQKISCTFHLSPGPRPFQHYSLIKIIFSKFSTQLNNEIVTVGFVCMYDCTIRGLFAKTISNFNSLTPP